MLFIFLFSLQEQNPVETGFKSPLVPWLPALALFFNIYLMIELSKLTWIRFAIWLALGKEQHNSIFKISTLLGLLISIMTLISYMDIIIQIIIII